MASVLLHVSDLHVGAGPALGEETLAGLQRLIAEHRPRLLVASGDLTHRNRPVQHEEAARLLRSLELPVLAVPGNHDIPAFPPRRFTRTFEAFSAVWGETEPVHRSDGLIVVGVSSVRPWLYQEGSVTSAQLERLGREFAAQPDATRVLVTHHHLASAPWRTAKRPLMRRSKLLEALRQLDVDLALAGHVHQSASAAAAEFYVGEGPNVVASTASGLGRPRPGRHAEVRGCQLWRIDAAELRCSTFSWIGNDLREVARRSFPRRERT